MFCVFCMFCMFCCFIISALICGVVCSLSPFQGKRRSGSRVDCLLKEEAEEEGEEEASAGRRR